SDVCSSDLEIEKAPVPKGTEAKILIATCVEFHIPAYALIITVRVSVSAYCKVRAALVSPFTQIRNTAFPPPAALCHFFRLRYYSYSSVFLSVLFRIIHRAAAQSQGKTQPKTSSQHSFSKRFGDFCQGLHFGEQQIVHAGRIRQKIRDHDD